MTREAAKTLEPGRDGRPIRYGPSRDTFARDKLTDALVREVPDGPTNLNFDPIANLYSRKRLSDRQHEAARRLQKDAERAEIQPCASSVLVGASGCTPQLPNDAKVDAMKRHGAARVALGAGWGLIEEVVERGTSVEKAAAALHLTPKFTMGMLWLALHMLADFYKLPNGSAQHIDNRTVAGT